eukprot:8800700-Pyramimonas_sp.AAC.1
MAAEIGEIEARALPALIMVLLDIEKAYPSVPRQAADQVFERAGIPESLRAKILALHGHCKYQ